MIGRASSLWRAKKSRVRPVAAAAAASVPKMKAVGKKRTQLFSFFVNKFLDPRVAEKTFGRKIKSTPISHFF